MEILVPTAFLPPISYVAEFLSSEEIIIEQSETYPKQTIRNHCLIYGPNGTQLLSVPVVKANGNHTLTRDVRLFDALSWQRSHWKSIETAYNNSPFFLYYKDDFSPFFEKKFEFLLDYNQALLEMVLRLLKKETKLRFTDRFEKNPAGVHDLRNRWGKHNPLVLPEYVQVFSSDSGFLSDLSIIDLLFNLGPESPGYLSSIQV